MKPYQITISFDYEGNPTIEVPPATPYARSAGKLAEDPSSGWVAIPSEDGLLRFSAPAKVVLPKPLRKGRPDAAAHLDAYRAGKGGKPKKPTPKAAKDPSLWPSEEELEAESRRADAAIEAERRKRAAKPPIEMLPDPEDPDDFDY